MGNHFLNQSTLKQSLVISQMYDDKLIAAVHDYINDIGDYQFII